MAENQGQGQQATEPVEPSNPQTPTEPTTPAANAAKYTDADLDKYKGTARDEGRTSAINKLLEDLGAESLDALKEGYSGWTEAQEEARTDLERAEQARQTAETQAQEYQQSMSKLQKEYALRDALRGADINPERLNFAMDSAKLDKLEISEGKVIDDSLTAMVDSYKESSPEWFGSTGANSGGDIGRSSGPGEGNQPKDLNQQIRDAEKAGNFQLAIALKSKLDNTA